MGVLYKFGLCQSMHIFTYLSQSQPLERDFFFFNKKLLNKVFMLHFKLCRPILILKLQFIDLFVFIISIIVFKIHTKLLGYCFFFFFCIIILNNGSFNRSIAFWYFRFVSHQWWILDKRLIQFCSHILIRLFIILGYFVILAFFMVFVWFLVSVSKFRRNFF